ncbi:MAG: hypothetical protein ACXWT1_18315 [Methylobacter sp.]
MKTKALIAGAVSMVLALTEGNSYAANCYYFNVTIQGETSIGDANSISAAKQFQTNQYLIARVPGQKGNPLDVILVSNEDLNANGQAGDILLMSNSQWAHNPGMRSTLTDMMSVKFDYYEQGQYLHFTVNTDASFMIPPANTFVAPGIGNTYGGLGGICFVPALQNLCQLTNDSQILSASFITPQTGAGLLVSDNGWNTFSGKIQISGSSLDNFNFIGYYNADMWGQFVGNSECE